MMVADAVAPDIDPDAVVGEAPAVDAADPEAFDDVEISWTAVPSRSS
jgi:hypothetical protein